MAYTPGVSFFIPFHELDPSKQSQCIFYTQKGARCSWVCQGSDNLQAIAIHKLIFTTSSEAVRLDLLQKYVLCNCCRKARHRDRIEDIGLLIPLARQWQDEIRRHIADQSNHTTSVSVLEDSIVIPHAYATLATSITSHTTTIYHPTANPSYYQPNARTSFSINTVPSKPVASSSSFQHSSPRSATTTKFAFQPFGSQPRYDLRPRKANISTSSTSTRPTTISQAPLSEFRPHIADPLPSDSVSRKILNPLKDRDFEIGWLYIFDRAPSPGYVKIGWTADSVSRRLEDWSKCEYNPNLLFSVGCVPHAQRVETLAHHELIKEWRRERMCKAVWCRKSHQEWFEISKERAVQVLGDWANFMKKAEPYDSKGWLENRWREVINVMVGNCEVVTAKKLLKHYEASLAEEATLVEESVDLGHAPKIEEEVGFGYGPKVGRLEAPKEALMRVGSLRIEQPTFPKEISLLKSEALPKQVSRAEIFPAKAEQQPQIHQLFERNSLQKTEPLSQNETLPRTQFLFTAEPPFKIQLLREIGLPFKADPLFKTEPLPESEPLHEEVLASERTPAKNELPPEQILLPSSPLLRSTTFPQDTLSSQEINSSLSAGIEEINAIHVITNSDTKISVVDTSFNPKINSSVSLSASASLSAINSPLAIPSEESPQTNTHTETDTSTNANSPPLEFLDSSSGPNLSNLSATSASPRPTTEAVSDSPAPLVTEISGALLSLSTDEQKELAETLTSITQRQQNVERDGQAEPESELLACDGRIREEEIKSHDQDEITATEKETETGTEEWDAEETLVEDQTPRSLEKAALEIVDGLCNEISTGKASRVLKGLDEPKVLQSEAPPAVEVVAEA